MKNTFLKAEAYVMGNGTEFQKACCSYVTGDTAGKASKEKLISELSKYQNSDGGFSNGLEIEYLGPVSSPFTTAVALGYLARFGLQDTPIYADALKYLKNTQHADGKWDDCEELDKYPHPPYMGVGIYPEYKTGMILKWLLRLNAADEQMIAKATEYLLNNFDRISANNDFWSAVAYSSAFSLLPHLSQFPRIMEWSMSILMPKDGIPGWQQVAGMIEDDIPIPDANLNPTLQMIKENQEEDGGWPHPFGTYNRVWAAVFILRFLKNRNTV